MPEMAMDLFKAVNLFKAVDPRKYKYVFLSTVLIVLTVYWC